MEFMLHEKASYSFYTYVFSNYDNFVKPLQKYIRNTYINDQGYEIVIQNAICKLLGERIRQLIPSIPQVKLHFNKSVKNLSKQDLDLIEFNQKFKSIEDKLKSYFKLHYSLDDIDCGNFELDHASLLMAIYLKVLSEKFQKNNKQKIEKTEKLKNSAIYQYLDSARKEAKYHTSLNQLSNLTMTELASWLYKSIAVFDYNNDNTILDDYIGILDDSDIQTVFNEITIIDFENNQESYDDFIKTVENNFNKKLIQEMHTLSNGNTF